MGRTTRIASGTGLVILGIVLLPLPGPGWVTIGAGLAVLSRDVEWAGRTLDWLKARLPSQLVEPESPTADHVEDEADRAGG